MIFTKKYRANQKGDFSEPSSFAFPSSLLKVPISSDELTSSLKCVSECFNNERFRKTQQEPIVNLLKGKDVLVLQPMG